MADTSHAVDEHGGEAHDAGAHGEIHGEVGAHDSGAFPPFDPTHFSSQLFWLAATFIVLYLVMSRIALPRIGSVIEERRDKIADDLDRAAELKLESETAIAAYEKALADAKAKAIAIAAETREKLDAEIAEMQAEVDEQLDQKLEAAEKSIAASKDQALEHIREIASDAAAAVVGQLLGADAGDADAARKAVTAELSARG